MSVKIKEIFLLIGFIFFSINVSAQINVKSSLPCNGAKLVKTEEQQKASISLSSAIKEQHINIGGRCLGWTNLEQGGIWYVAAKEVGIFAVDVNINKYLESWQFSNYLCNNSDDDDCTPEWWEGRWSNDEVLEKAIVGQYPSKKLGWAEIYDTDDTQMGCIQRTPLRYGDLAGNGESDLVLLLPNGYSVDLAVFSTAKKKTIFATKLGYNDVIDKATALPRLMEYNYHAPNADEDYQYLTRSEVENYNTGTLMQSFRGFGKLYVGHFLAPDSNDLLVWRKLYKSRLIKDPIKGFEKVSDTFIHYKLINGEYQKQATPEETIKSWLAAKQLTWQKGYPSKSECPGQEGQLIPEMHDPLLNDPDVLQ